MSDSEPDPLSSLLSSFALGPAWARATGDKQEHKPKTFSGGEGRPPRRDDRERGGRPGGGRDRDGGERRPFQGRGGQDDRRNAPPRFEEAPPADGVRVTIAPDAQAVHLIGKEVHQVARVYPLFDVAKILLAEMGEARLRAEEKLAALNAAHPTMTERGHLLLHELCVKLSKNYHELEKSIADRVDVSRQTLLRWEAETRELAKYVQSLRKLMPA